MDEDHKGCLIVGGVFFFGSCGMVILITSLAVILKIPSVSTQQSSTGSDSFWTPLFSLLTLLIELVKYLMTPFVPMLRVLG